MPRFAPVEDQDGYPRLESLGLVGDGSTAALIGLDGTLHWLCVPRFDSAPLFCALLDQRRGGAFRLRPEGLREARHWYEPDTGVLVTEMRTEGALLRVTDALLLRSGADLAEGTRAARGDLVRSVEVLDGEARIRVEIEPRGGARFERQGVNWRVECPARPDLELWAWCSHPLDGPRSQVRLRAGERLDVQLHWGGPLSRVRDVEIPEMLVQTADAWRRWAHCIRYEGPHAWIVRRSAITLKLLDHFENGAIVAAPTSSLPEKIGGVRNWDYRYAWVRDTAFSVYALNRIGLGREATRFLGWALDAAEKTGRLSVLFDIDGGQPAAEREDPELEGYRGSAPVRWGNGAADQVQNDVYGEMLDCAYQWHVRGGQIEPELWATLRRLVDEAGRAWSTPDRGIWEVRSDGRRFTYSAAMCQVALDRGAKIAEALGHSAEAARWRAESERVRQAILEEAWDAERETLTEHLGGDGALDASLLALPLRRVLPADHPRMVATARAVTEDLGAGGGLLFRYHPAESPDGLPGDEGAFLLCSFWLVDNLALQGRLQEASDLYDALCARASTLGLLPEQIDPDTGAFLGNFPQAFSHVGLISSAVTLARAQRLATGPAGAGG